MTSKFTPGPWEFYSDPESEGWEEPDEAWRIRAPNCGKIFNVLMSNTRYYPSCPDNEADWRLIAAAPELYEALIALLSASEKHIFGDECLTEREAARAALAKVES